MGLMERVGRVVRAQVTHWVSQAEDPERILEQTVQDMQADVVELRQAVAQAVATLKRSERQLVQADANASEWQRRAFLAGENGQEALAREALSKRQGYIATAESLSSQIANQRQLIGQLKTNLRLLDRKLEDSKAKKDLYVARARSAAATHRMNELLERTAPEGTEAVFDRMEEKILTLEAQAALTAEMQRDPLTDRFAQLESQNQAESDYQALQQQVDLPLGQHRGVNAQMAQPRSAGPKPPELPRPARTAPHSQRRIPPSAPQQPGSSQPELPSWR